MAWQQDEERIAAWRSIRTEPDLLLQQRELRRKVLMMMGGLPTVRTPLQARITGSILMNGFHIDKVIFESLPGVYVTALVLSFLIFIRAILSWFPNISPRNPLSEFLITMTEPILAPLRAVMPRFGMMDLTPMIAIIVLQVIAQAFRP